MSRTGIFSTARRAIRCRQAHQATRLAAQLRQVGWQHITRTQESRRATGSFASVMPEGEPMRSGLAVIILKCAYVRAALTMVWSRPTSTNCQNHPRVTWLTVELESTCMLLEHSEVGPRCQGESSIKHGSGIRNLACDPSIHGLSH